MPSVTIIDPTLIADTYARLGLNGLNALAARGTHVFVSTALRVELELGLSNNPTGLSKIIGSSGDTLLICLRINLPEVKEEIFVGGHDRSHT
jgi:hypothetical protein